MASYTWIGADKILLIKDDLVWTTKTEYTTNNNEITLTQITDYFPAIQNYVFSEGEREAGKLFIKIFLNLDLFNLSEELEKIITQCLMMFL